MTQQNEDRTATALMICLVFASFIFAMLLTAASPQDAKKCQEVTGWTSDRCYYELNH